MQLNEKHSVLFAATYAERVLVVAVANIGADFNLMDEKPLTRITKADGVAKITQLKKPIKLYPAVMDSSDWNKIAIICDRIAIVTVTLHVRHGSTLFLRNLRRLVTKQE